MNNRNQWLLPVLIIFLITSTALLATGCRGGENLPANQKITLDFFAADDVFEVAVSVAHLYGAHDPRVDVRITYDEGASLAAMIEAGYRCDVYLADHPSYIDWLDGDVESSANPNGNDLLIPGSRTDLIVKQAQESEDGEEFSEHAYSIAAINSSAHPAEAEKFIAFLKDGSCDAIYEEYGYSRVAQP